MIRKRRWLWLVALVALIGVIIGGVQIYRTAQDKFYRAKYPLKYTEWVETYAAQYDLDPALVYAVICTESGFDASAQSGAGAIGLMQMTPDTFDWAQFREKVKDPIGKEMLTDPETNIHYGCATLHHLGQLFSTENAVLAAYNAGMGNVSKWLSDPAYSDDGETLHTIPFKETRNYVQKVAAAKEMYRSLYGI